MQNPAFSPRRAATALEQALPETLEEAEALAASIEQAVHHHTAGGVRNLSVLISGNAVVLRGRCETFYCKQLAQQAAMAGVPSSRALTNAIEVS